MRKTFFITICLILCICLSPLAAQEAKKSKKPAVPNSKAPITWVKTFGSPEFDSGYSIKQTSNGGYIVAGYTFYPSLQWPDLWILRLDANGAKIWEQKFENAVHGSEEYAVSEGADGGFWILAPRDIGKGYASRVVVRVIRLDNTGKVLLDKNFTENSVAGFSILAAPDGGCLVGGYGSNAGVQVPWLMKLDSQGNLLWERFMDGTGTEPISAIVRTPDDHYIVATSSSWKKGFRIMKLKSDGGAIWSRRYYSDNENERIRAMAMTSDGGFVLSGETGNTSFSGFIMKLNGNGDLQWDRRIHGTIGRLYAQPTDDGGFLAVSSQENNKMRKMDILVAKFDDKGKVLWSKAIGEQGTSYLVFALDRTSDSGFVITGGKGQLMKGNMDLVVIKIDTNGQAGRLKALSQPPDSEENVFNQR